MAPPSRRFLFRSSTIIEGDDVSSPYIADLLVDPPYISAIAPHLSASLGGNVEEVDARGKVLCPGFIDMHAHSDLYLLTHPEHEAKVSQGVTTEVVGQDGISYYPIDTAEQMSSVRAQIAGWNGNPSDDECASQHAGVGIFEWRTVGEYMDCLDRNGTAVNVGVLVPQGNLRLLACGPNDTQATKRDLARQCALLSESMSAGALGMSSGLTYTPGMYASTSELSVLCGHLARHFPRAYYAPHHRSYGKGCLGAYEEMLDIGRATGCAVHLTHATMNFAENRGRGQELLDMVDRFRAEGVDVSLDTYPYLPGSTTLAALLPSWATEGGPSATTQRLRDDTTCQRILHDIEVIGADGSHGLPIDWGAIEIASTGDAALERWQGSSVVQVAQDEGWTPGQAFLEVLRRDEMRTSILMHVGHEENVRTIMQHETHCAGSDGILHGSRTHPRAWATMTRYIAHYSLGLSLIPLPRMIAHLTSRPARRLGIYPARGRLAVGSIADLVLFDPARIRDAATFAEPKARSEGIEWVLVNGVPVVERGEMTRARPGGTLRRQADGRVLGVERGRGAHMSSAHT